jgi:hypothetical protein
MKRITVESSNLHSVGYDSDTQTLEIEFRNSGIYQYYGVPETVYRQLMAATSHGKFFYAHIRDVCRYGKIK